MSNDQVLAASKLEDGNIRAAVRTLCSSDRPVAADPGRVVLKHPEPSPGQPPIPASRALSDV